MFDNILYRPVKGARSIDWRLTQAWGERPRFYKKIGRPYHLGVDYAGPNSGDKVDVYSATSGIVEKAGWDDSGFGNRIVVGIGDYRVYYCHLDSIDVAVGQSVKPNDKIGVMGTTGKSDGVHLHFGLKGPGGNKKELGRLNPTPFIRDREPAPITVQIQDPLIQQLIDNGIYNGIEGDGVTYRNALMIAKLYDKLLKLTGNK